MIAAALREIQERYGYLPQEELEFLALRARVPLYRVQEVASFFPHFHREKPPPVTVQVCQSMTCHLRGAADLYGKVEGDFQQPIHNQSIRLEKVSCLGRCDRAPAACVHLTGPRSEVPVADHYRGNLDSGDSRAEFRSVITSALAGKTPVSIPRPASAAPLWQINIYDPRHGQDPPPSFASVREYLANREPSQAPLALEKVLNALKTAGLVGMGGAAARTGKKWSDVNDAAGQEKYVVCNGDESEPGTFKDREILLHAPALVVEGMLLAGLMLKAKRGYIYIRHEYPEQIEAVRKAIAAAADQVPDAIASCPLEVFVSPGAYICGEESALLEVIEGRRAQPRNTPPEIRTNGLFDKPTLVNNVETFAWIPVIMHREEGKWFNQAGLRFFSVSGHVRRPGVREVPINTTLGALLNDQVGGMSEGYSLKAIATSGPSGGFLPRFLKAADLRQALARSLPGLRERAKLEAQRVERFRDRALAEGVEELDILDLELDVALFRALDLALGAGIVIYGEKATAPSPMLNHAINCLEFFQKESCGKCVPCRLGSQQLVQLASNLRQHSAPTERLEEIEPVVRTLAQVMEGTSICGLGRVAANPFLSWLDYFRHELPISRNATANAVASETDAEASR